MALPAGRVSSVHLVLMTQAMSLNPGCREHSSTRFALVVMLTLLIQPVEHVEKFPGLVGEVLKVDKEPGRLYKSAVIKTAEDLSKLEEVMCIG